MKENTINTKHTPGKWEVRKQRKSGIGNTGFGFAILLPLLTKEGEYKGQVGGYHVVLHQDAGLSEKEANSICDKHNEVLEKISARELLETIDDVSNRIAYCIDLWNMPEEAIAMLRGEIDVMLSAIKKATE